MSNKHASKQHCLVGNKRPVSGPGKKRRKAKAAILREEKWAKMVKIAA